MTSNKYEYIEENEFATVLSTDVTGKGVLHSQEATLVKGSLYDSEVNGTLVVVAEKGVLAGNITAQYLVVSGLVDGELVAQENLHVLKGGEIRGVSSAYVFIVDANGKVNSQCHMISSIDKLPKKANNNQTNKVISK